MARRDEPSRVAVEAVEAAGDYLRETFRRVGVANEDAVRAAAVDATAEGHAVDPIASAFPDHAVVTTTVGEGDASVPSDATEPASDTRWVVDPLDGLDNFTAGLPTFSTAATLVRDGDPVVSAVHLPTLDDTYLAIRGEGVTHDGTPTNVDCDLPGEAATVAFVVGHDARAEPEGLAITGHLRNTLEVRTRRVVESWAPTVHWALLTRGLIQGVVAYEPDPEELYAGELLADEAGLGTTAGDTVTVAAANDAILAELEEITDPVF